MQAVIALGSNLGEPDENLREATRRLASLSVQAPQTSSIWRSAPVGFVDAVPEFSNAVVVIDTRLKSRELLIELQRIELDMGLERSEEDEGHESRTIDLDIIDLGGQLLNTPLLKLPHPRAHMRRFVLQPLQEIIPQFRFPDRSADLVTLIAEAPADPVRCFSRLSLSD